MIIAQISDTHIDLENPIGIARIENLERCVADINGLDPLPDILIHTGDLAHNGTLGKYAEAERVLAALRCPIHIAVGNRDDRAVVGSKFPAGRNIVPNTPFVQYALEAYPVRLIALDTLSETTNMGDFCEVRADSLRRTLAEDATKPTAIFMHHPPFEVTQSKYPWQYDSPEAIALLGRVLDGRNNVVRAFCGHAHRDAAGTVAGVPMSTVPSVAVDLRLGDFPDAAAPVYQIHKFDTRRGFVTETRVAQ